MDSRIGWLSLIAWALSIVFGLLWWRCYRTGVAYHAWGFYKRAKEPGIYWSQMLLLGAPVVVMTICALAFSIEWLSNVVLKRSFL